MRLRGFLFVLAVSIIADAHIITAVAGDHVIVEPICGASLPTLTRDARPAALQSVVPLPSTMSQNSSPLLHGPVAVSSTLEPSLSPNGHWHQDQLHDLVHVFLF